MRVESVAPSMVWGMTVLGLDLTRVGQVVVGRDREVELVAASLAAARNVLLEGPPGTGKSTLLRAVAAELNTGFVFVEGNAELTPARLIGSHDPARVLSEGYSAETFVDGPLVQALRDGSLLYVEEINRVPEETLNVLVTVMSERELIVPRIGLVAAAPAFRIVAAMNPFDAVGTGRISAAIYDRTCRVAMDYQSAVDEGAIVSRAVTTAGGAEIEADRLANTVQLVRDTRAHSEIRIGSSVRGAIDMELLTQQLAAIRGVGVDDTVASLDAATTALSGRIRIFEGSGRTPDEIIEELWIKAFTAKVKQSSSSDGGDESGKAPAR